MHQLVPPHIEKLQPYRAGKPIAEVQQEYGLERVVKLASNENPLGPSPLAAAAASRALSELHRYPDPNALKLRWALATRFRLSIDNVIVGNGSEGIMAGIVRVFLQGDDEVITSDAAFLGFPILCRTRGVEPITVPLKEYRFDLDALADRITARTRLIYLCNPNNPTGTIFTRDEFDRFMARVPRRVLVIQDEAYHEFASHHADYPDSMDYRYDNVITLRTFSKAYGLAGLRVGYGFGHDHLIGSLWKVKLPFEPSAMAQAAGVAALGDYEFLDRTLALTRQGLEFYYRELPRLGLRYLPSRANFVMVLTDSPEEVQRIFGEMLRKGVIVRPLEQAGLPHCVRITVGTPEENQICVDALEAVLRARKTAPRQDPS
ncbi:MAG: histidinol-phosphate transaminase [Armatimonadetes bacterium]|nr:histidinol-phosphate transaminase [Armatimonadota bacterium]